nr:anthranilate phosphoribosyltransferase [Planctomycetota bacterium]
MHIQQALQALLNKQNLSYDEMREGMLQNMIGNPTGAQIGGFLIRFRYKSETIGEIAPAAEVMLELSIKGDI